MKAFAIKLSLLTMLLSCAGFAQTSSITGTVSTESGGPLANASVNLENLTSGVRQQAVSDSTGHYAFNGLPAGRYQLGLTTTQATGTPSQEIALAADQSKTINITMQSAGTTTVAAVKVEETTPSLDTATPQIVNTENTRYVQYLQQSNFLEKNGKAFGAYNLSLLNAGVASNGGIGTSAGPIVDGQRPWSNNFYIEGVDNNNRLIPGPLLYVPNEATTEAVSIQSQFPPEFSHTLGGQFNTIVRTGTNQFHGALYEYLQNRNLDAVDQSYSNQGIRDLPRYDQNRLGANLGFPIIKNKLFFFGDFEYIPLGFAGVPNAPVLVPTSAGYSTLAGLPGVSATNLNVLQNYAGAAPTATSTTTVNGTTVPVGILPLGPHEYQNQYIGTGSLDWNISDSDQIRGRFFQNQLNANNNGAALPAFFEPMSDRSLLASVSEYHNFSPVVVNEIRLGYQRFDQSIHNNGVSFPGLTAFPSIFIENSNLQLGSGLLASQPASLNTYQVTDNLNWNLGRHVLKMGGEGRRFIGPVSFANLGVGNYDYTTLSRFLLDQTPDINGERSFGNLTYSGNNWDSFVYINDGWQVSSNFNLNLGVRWNYVTIPKSFELQGLNSIADVPGVLTFHAPNPQYTAFSPVIGLAWSPGFVKNTVFRAGFTMNYDTTYTASTLPSVPPGTVTTVFSNAFSPFGGFFGFGGIVYPYAFNIFTPSVTPAQARAATTSYIPDQVLPYSMNWNAGIQQQIFHRFVLDLRYVGVKAQHLPTEGLLNAVSPVTATQNLPLFTSAPPQATLNALPTTLTSLQATTTNPLASAGFTSPISSVQPNGWSWYNGLQVQLSNRFSGGFQTILSYSWSHLIDNLSGPLFNQFGLSTLAEQQYFRGTSVYDHRNDASATLLWDVGGIGKSSFNFVRDILANLTYGVTYRYESPQNFLLNSGLNTDLTGFGAGSVIVNPSGAAGVGSGVSPLRNSSGQVVGYLANNPNAQFISAGPGMFVPGSRNFLEASPINNFDMTLFKRFSVRDKFSLEFHGDAFNVFNHPQFTPSPLHDIGTGNQISPGLLIPSSASFANFAGGFPSNARLMQVGVRLMF